MERASYRWSNLYFIISCDTVEKGITGGIDSLYVFYGFCCALVAGCFKLFFYLRPLLVLEYVVTHFLAYFYSAGIFNICI